MGSEGRVPAGAPSLAVVGSGVVSAAGRGPERTLSALRDGTTSPQAPRTIASELAERHPVFEVDEGALSGSGLRLPGGRGRRSLRMALLAAHDAVREATSCGALDVAPERIGVVVGATVGGMNHGEQWIEESLAPSAPSVQAGPAAPVASALPAREVAARPAIRHLPLWEISCTLAQRFGFRGPAFAVSTACTSGAQAIATAGDLVAAGVCDAVLAGGVDCLARLTYHGFAALGVMAQRRATPFHVARAGLNLGEGAAFVVLVRDTDLAARADAFSRLVGWGSNTDAHHMTAPRPDGTGVASAMRAALDLARLAPEDVGWVHAHGTATPTNDAVEASAIRAVFGPRRVPVSSTKHVFGHTLGAAGSIASVVTLLALRERFVPGNAAVVPDPGCDVDVVPPEGARLLAPRVVVSSLGFGGASCALLFSGAGR